MPNFFNYCFNQCLSQISLNRWPIGGFFIMNIHSFAIKHDVLLLNGRFIC